MEITCWKVNLSASHALFCNNIFNLLAFAREAFDIIEQNMALTMFESFGFGRCGYRLLIMLLELIAVINVWLKGFHSTMYFSFFLLFSPLGKIYWDP